MQSCMAKINCYDYYIVMIQNPPKSSKLKESIKLKKYLIDYQRRSQIKHQKMKFQDYCYFFCFQFIKSFSYVFSISILILLIQVTYLT
ncbi:unnamed protein product [Paramecium sonneborni]|uniref:Transmembrane protein n=1 Tax=Paramecium sonneborni TaxID=65129 RepID=A0A8S1NIV3_9CILI|nr:unnamed protein product [Paramecium sonneborni]